MVLTMVNADFATRLTVDGSKIDRLEECEVVGVCLRSNLKWEKKTKELTRKAYARVSMLTKLKYVGPSLCLYPIYQMPSRILCSSVALKSD